jgi:hypothetical protein
MPVDFEEEDLRRRAKGDEIAKGQPKRWPFLLYAIN